MIGRDRKFKPEVQKSNDKKIHYHRTMHFANPKIKKISLTLDELFNVHSIDLEFYNIDMREKFRAILETSKHNSGLQCSYHYLNLHLSFKENSEEDFSYAFQLIHQFDFLDDYFRLELLLLHTISIIDLNEMKSKIYYFTDICLSISNPELLYHFSRYCMNNFTDDADKATSFSIIFPPVGKYIFILEQAFLYALRTGLQNTSAGLYSTLCGRRIEYKKFHVHSEDYLLAAAKKYRNSKKNIGQNSLVTTQAKTSPCLFLSTPSISSLTPSQKLNIFVAGIKCDAALKKKNAKEIFEHIILGVPNIINDANKKFTNPIILIILHEYAATEDEVISQREKNECIELLQGYLKNHSNILFIPGSLAFYKTVNAKNHPSRIDKTMESYENLMLLKDYSTSGHFRDELTQCEKISLSSSDTIFLLRNTAYLLDGKNKLNHRKTYPCKESKRFFNQYTDFVYDIKSGNPIKSIRINDIEIDIGIMICAEAFSTEITDALYAKKPHIQIIISNTVNIETSKLYGAINVHMDSNSGLTVYQNESHYRSNVIADVKSMEYTFGDKNHVISKTEYLLSVFDEDFSAPSMKNIK